MRETANKGAEEFAAICPNAGLLNLLKGRWTSHIVFTLGERGPLRFAELQRTISSELSAKSLTENLAKLVDGHLVTRTEMPSAAREVIYELSVIGREAHDALKSLHDVAGKLDALA